MDFTSRLCLLFIAITFGYAAALQGDVPEKLSDSQRLVIAAFELDVAQVKALLEKGAKPDARLGFYDRALFEDKWSLGSPINSNSWTALLAVAHSHREPQPAERAENTTEGREIAEKKRAAVDPKLIRERDKQRVAIAKLLIAAKANLDLDDGYGATAFATSVDNQFDDLSLVLIAAGAKVNTKTGVYIDGPADDTPLHEATRGPSVVEALLKRGAAVNAKNSTGDTPLHSAVLHANEASVKLLLDAGADVDAKDEVGHTPDYWCRTSDVLDRPDDAVKKRIAKLLSDARSKKLKKKR